ncbi:MAG: hypothetical protein PHU51_06135 [Candidatus Nanoarchaeia archaeon]|nr:hypothetical protein [Candidatus Nanoarchaeia archaeon]
MRVLISAILVFGVLYCAGILSLSLFGETTVGVIDSYANRRVNAKDYSDRMRSITKTYHFYVGGKRYTGFASYLGSEIKTVIVGREDEPKREPIRYMPILPYINCPEHLTNLDLWGVLYYCAAIPACVLLLLLANGQTLSKTAANNGSNRRGFVIVRRGKPYDLKRCRTQMAGNAALRERPGAPAEETALPLRDDAPGLVGWSSRCDDPEILTAAQNNRKSAFGCAWVLAFLFPTGFAIAGLFVEELPLGEALIIGTGLGVLMMVINLLHATSMKKPVWEGTVTEKSQRDKRKYDRSDNVTYYTEFVLVIQTTTGKTHRIARDNHREMYDYFKVGDRVRYHPAFATYEKFDKSRDSIIYCNVCSMMNPISNDRCERCANLLFK